MESWPASAVVALTGALGGIVLGLAARLGRFCTLAAFEDAMFGGDGLRLRVWGLAAAIAIFGVALIGAAGIVDFRGSIYHAMPLNPVAWIIGGLLFGIGMALCGTCAYGTLVRLGGGDLRALIVFIVLGISSYMAIAGPTALLRTATLNHFILADGPDAPRSVVDLVAHSQPFLAFALPTLVAALIAMACLSNAQFRRSPRHIWGGAAVGLAIVAGWLSTGVLGADVFEPQPLASHSYSLPLGQTLIYVMTMSSAPLTFGIGTTFGVICGAYLGSMIKGDFRWEAADDAREMRRHLLGAFLMGTGGVYAGGCTIGQGLSAASLLTFSAPVVIASIWCGVWLGLTYMMEGSFSSALRYLAGR
jgi:uncharacterized membrane protein YedE/YeeE